MVKNNGGNKSKKLGRKFINVPIQKATRYSKQDDEIYAVVTKLLGGSNCEVLCNDNQNRLCVIRNKFRGRSKRDNFIAIGTWLLVGLRSWETSTATCKMQINFKKSNSSNSINSSENKKLDKCDLLEVYSVSDKENIKQNKKINVKILTTAERLCTSKDNTNNNEYDDDDDELFDYITNDNKSNNNNTIQYQDNLYSSTYLRPNKYLNIINEEDGVDGEDGGSGEESSGEESSGEKSSEELENIKYKI